MTARRFDPTEIKGETVRLQELPMLKRQHSSKLGTTNKWHNLRGTINSRIIDGNWYCIPDTKIWAFKKIARAIRGTRQFYDRLGIMADTLHITHSVSRGIIFRWVRMDRQAFIEKVQETRLSHRRKLDRMNDYRKRKGMEPIADIPIDPLPDFITGIKTKTRKAYVRVAKAKVKAVSIKPDAVDRPFTSGDELAYINEVGDRVVVTFMGHNSAGCVVWDGSGSLTVAADKLTHA